MLSDPHPPSVDPYSLGQRIAGLRHAHGLSQRRLAEAAGVSHGYIALLELGRLPSPGKFRLDAVARALNLRTSDALVGPLAHLELESGSESGQSSAVPPEFGDTVVVAEPFLMREPAPLQRRLLQEVRLAQAGAATLEPTASVAANANVLGSLDQVRSHGARLLPVFRWGSCGDPRDRESPPDPDRLEFPPPGRETLIGPNGFGVVIKGDSMVGRGINDGDVVWVNPERAYQIGKVVLALVSDVGGASGMVVKTYARTDVGECLVSETAEGRSPVVCREFKVIGPVVGISSWRLPT
jgi:SOS-response transcriptional repressor LexA